MKTRILLLILLTTFFCCSFVYGECPEGSNWVASWTDEFNNTTYTLEAPCKVYIGIPFNITATVTDANVYCSNSWVASFWGITDNGVALEGCAVPWPNCPIQNKIYLVNGQWQKIIQQTYSGDPVNHTIGFLFVDHGVCSGFHNAVGSLIGGITVDPLPGLSLSCIGFEPPLDKSPIKFKENRVLPLKAQLDDNGTSITDLDITALPVVQVLFDSGTGGDPVDVSGDILSAGHETDGNQFVFTDEGKWQFNLKTKNYTAPGTYTVSMETGDSSEYTIDPTCTVDFIIE